MSSTTHLQETDQPVEELAAAKPGRFSTGTIVLLVGLVALALVFGIALSRQNQMQPTEGAAPDFSVTTFDNQTYKLADWRGKVVVVNFWASWCVPCADEAPELEATWKQYESSGEVVFLGIAYADNGPRSLEFIDKYGITYLNAPDLGTRISDDYNIRGVPETFIIGRDGQVVEFIYAGVNQANLSAIIERALVQS